MLAWGASFAYRTAARATIGSAHPPGPGRSCLQNMERVDGFLPAGSARRRVAALYPGGRHTKINHRQGLPSMTTEQSSQKHESRIDFPRRTIGSGCAPRRRRAAQLAPRSQTSRSCEIPAALRLSQKNICSQGVSFPSGPNSISE